MIFCLNTFNKVSVVARNKRKGVFRLFSVFGVFIEVGIEIRNGKHVTHTLRFISQPMVRKSMFI